MDTMHNDEQADVELICRVLEEKLEPIVTVLKQMLDKMAAMDDEIDGLEKLVNEEIIGGITNLYNTKERLSGISGLSSKYGELMGPYKDFYSEMTDGADLYEKLYDELEEFKASAESVDDAAIDAKVQELASILKSKFEKVQGLGKPQMEVEIEVEKKPEAMEEKPSGDDLIEKIRKMKAKAGDVKF